LRNKQKKAARKAEQEKREQQQLQAKKDAHNKAKKAANNEEEMDSPAKDELLPEKLERPEDALAEAMKFLAPLQALAAKRHTTHVLAFEIHWRRKKPLLMLQCIKR